MGKSCFPEHLTPILHPRVNWKKGMPALRWMHPHKGTLQPPLAPSVGCSGAVHNLYKVQLHNSFDIILVNVSTSLTQQQVCGRDPEQASWSYKEKYRAQRRRRGTGLWGSHNNDIIFSGGECNRKLELHIPESYFFHMFNSVFICVYVNKQYNSTKDLCKISSYSFCAGCFINKWHLMWFKNIWFQKTL